jgi:tetratricopeptide (TPR) repeat protein
VARTGDLDPGAKLGGYTIDTVLGRGGMGTVYRAKQLALNREVALKLLASEFAGDDEFRERFLRECELAASLDHPNVVPVYDAGEADGALYIAMRYVPGIDLRSMIRREGRLSPHLAIAVLEQVAAALDAAHALGLVHRDVKPSNVLIADEHGAEATVRAFLCDFGLSKRIADVTNQTTERPLWTAHYVSPEQIRGNPVDARADIYSLGCVLYECLTGSVPFPRESDVAVLYAHLEAAPPRVSSGRPELPSELDDVVFSALAKSRAERPASASELIAAAGATFAGGGLGSRAPLARSSQGHGTRPLSAPPGRRLRRPFVGRSRETEHLDASLDRALAGGGSVVLLTGEAGIGKTTLARAVSERAEQQGLPVVWGVGLRGEAAPAYFHWVQVIRGLAQRRGGPELFAGLGPAAGWLGELMPDLGLDVPATPDSTGSDQDRFRIYDAILRLLQVAAERPGLVVVLDDLHYADEASLLVLSFIARAIDDCGVLIVATSRDQELDHAKQLGSPLAEIASLSQRIELQPLDAHGVRTLCEARGVSPRSSGLVERIQSVTEGNPLFVSELLTLLESGDLTDDGPDTATPLRLPTGVRDAIAQRLAPLDPATHDALSAASVIGPRFRADVLERAVGIPALDLLELLDEALSLRLLRPLTGPGDEYAFSHSLVHASLYDALPRSRRVALHHAVAEALERTYHVAAGEGIAEVAHHYLEAAAGGDRDRAIEYARRAARQAVEKFAYDQAVSLLSRALAITEPDSPEDRITILQALGEAQMRAGDTVGARGSLVQAAEAARVRGDAQALGRAALACGIWGLSFGVDEQLVRLAEEALGQLENGGDPGLLARVKGLLSAALYYTDERERRERLCADALALARAEHQRRRSRDSGQALAYVLGRYLLAMWGPRSAERDFGLSDELLELALALPDGELEVLTRNWRISVLLELGSFAAVDQEIARVEQMATELRQPRAMVFLPLHHAVRAAAAGRLTEAERLNAESFEIGRRVRGSVGELAGTAQLVGIRLLQGRLPELEAPLRAMANANPGMLALQCALATLLVQAGRYPEARAELERLTSRGLAGFPADNTHIVMLALIGDVAAQLGDADRAGTAYRWLEPYRGRWVVSAGAAAVWPVDRSLGALAVATGRPEHALEHLTAAREQAERAGAMTSLALIALDLARAHHVRGRSDDLTEAGRLSREARQLAQELGIGLVVDAATLLEAGSGVA